VDEVDEIYAMKGKKLVHFDLTRTKPSREELLAVLLGPSGNLRAPTIRNGRTLLVGFDEATYRKALRIRG
jgi:arsenate reductase-like glutaredoxin family protein